MLLGNCLSREMAQLVEFGSIEDPSDQETHSDPNSSKKKKKTINSSETCQDSWETDGLPSTI